MKVLISAAEVSSDAHGAELLKAIRQALPEGEELEAFGIGGTRLQAAGLRAVIDARELLAMGFTEILGRLPRILKAVEEVASESERVRPDVAIVIDYPDFHFRLSKRLSEQGIPLIYFIPPKVWAWRKSRIKTLKERFAKLLCILPFEEAFYERENVPAKYVGNPLLDELPLSMTREEARSELGIGAESRVLTLMPGSRPSELKRHVPVMLAGAVRAAALLRTTGWLAARDPLKVLIPLPEAASIEVEKARIDSWLGRGGYPILDVRVSRGDSARALLACDMALVKSGTSTLEAALLRAPHSVVYRPSWVSGQIWERLISYEGPVGLVNLVAGWKPGDRYVAEEILVDEVTEKRLASEIVALATDSSRRERMALDFERIRRVMGVGQPGSPSERAAREVIATVRGLRKA